MNTYPIKTVSLNNGTAFSSNLRPQEMQMFTIDVITSHVTININSTVGTVVYFRKEKAPKIYRYDFLEVLDEESKRISISVCSNSSNYGRWYIGLYSETESSFSVQADAAKSKFFNPMRLE